MEKKYWIVMLNGKPLTTDYKLPIFWYKKVAINHANRYDGARVYPVVIKLPTHAPS